jgi:hypothetical protein
MELAGGCLCGAIRYRVVGPPLWAAHCHCESCRRATGAPVATYAGFATENFAWTAGEPASFASSPGVLRTFCVRCGTSLTYQGERWPGEIHVLAATLDRPEAVTPQGEAFIEERLPWLRVAPHEPCAPATPEVS